MWHFFIQMLHNPALASSNYPEIVEGTLRSNEINGVATTKHTFGMNLKATSLERSLLYHQPWAVACTDIE